MPLLDHFNPPLNRTHPWRSFHGAWAAAMARLLNQGVLPPGPLALETSYLATCTDLRIRQAG
jgi:hypothetical protein